MALQMAVHREGYSYTMDVTTLDNTTIAKSKEQFEYLKQAGIIHAPSYQDSHWYISNEVIKRAEINFQLDEVHFVRTTSKKLNCTLAQYQQAMRVVLTSRFGYAVNTLQSDVLVLRNFANHLKVPKDYAAAQLLADLLVLLPGDSVYRMEVMNQIDDIPRLDNNQGKPQRNLAHYQSYLRFMDIFDEFWVKATQNERILFFPIWFWWKITAVLPLRPTECVLTPRNCINLKNGKYYLTVRRSKLKGKLQGSQYTIDSDYELHEYPIPEHLASPIQSYIAATQISYLSDIDVLFCKASQFAESDVMRENDHHYTYSNLYQCLSYFYRDIVRGRYGLKVVADTNALMSDEIERINLGDTRHIAMISLAISGGSPTICRELAGHDNISISSHYYTNLTQFLDVLGYECFRDVKSDITRGYGVSISTQYPVEGGYCQCSQVWQGDYSPCSSAVDSYGKPGSCAVCRWYMPRKGQIFMKTPAILPEAQNRNSPKDAAALELKQTCTLLKQAVDQLRKGLGNMDTLSCVLDQLAAQSLQYAQATAIEKISMEGAY